MIVPVLPGAQISFVQYRTFSLLSFTDDYFSGKRLMGKASKDIVSLLLSDLYFDFGFKLLIFPSLLLLNLAFKRTPTPFARFKRDLAFYRLCAFLLGITSIQKFNSLSDSMLVNLFFQQ